MPTYDYRCNECSTVFEARHSFDAPPPPCPNGHQAVHRILTRAPRLAKGMAALASPNADKRELQAKWAEETPKLRQKLVDKLGEETVRKYGGDTLNYKGS